MLDAEEYDILMRIKELKVSYKENYNELQVVKSEVDYTQVGGCMGGRVRRSKGEKGGARCWVRGRVALGAACIGGALFTYRGITLQVKGVSCFICDLWQWHLALWLLSVAHRD